MGEPVLGAATAEGRDAGGVLHAGEARAAIQAGGKVVVDFTASWCGPCKMIAPFFQELADKYGEGYTFCKIDVDEEDDCAAEHGISAMPTFLAFKGGAKVGTP